MALMQLIWRGKTTASIPNIPQHRQCFISPKIYHEVTPKKVQNHATFKRLLGRVSAIASDKRQALGLAPDHPAVLVLDNVSSHAKELMTVVSGFENLYAVTEEAGLFCYFGIPNLSHMCNPGTFRIGFLRLYGPLPRQVTSKSTSP